MKLSTRLFLLVACLSSALLPVFSAGDEGGGAEVHPAATVLEREKRSSPPEDTANSNSDSANETIDVEGDLEYSIKDSDTSDDGDDDKKEIEDDQDIDLSSVAEVIESSNQLLRDMKDELDHYVEGNDKGKDDISKLTKDTAELARQIGKMFRRMKQGEADIMVEVKEIKHHLDGAVDELKTELDTNRMRRHLQSGGGEYKACVVIEPTKPFPSEQGGPPTKPAPAVREFMPTVVPHPNGPGGPGFQQNSNFQQPPQGGPGPNKPPFPMVGQAPNQLHPYPSSAGQQGSRGPRSPNAAVEDVDLTQVYWVHLDPSRSLQSLQELVMPILKDKQSSGRDILMIPISHKFKNAEEVKDGFIRAVRVKPAVLKSLKVKRAFRQLRSLHIAEV